MYPGHYPRTQPGKAAAISARTGEALTYAEFGIRSNRPLRDRYGGRGGSKIVEES